MSINALDPPTDGPPPVVVAEDDPQNRLILCRMLKRFDRSVVRAVDGVQAVRYAAHYGTDLVLMDLNMPDMDGIAAIRALRADPVTAAVRVVAVTADTTEATRRACEDAGFDGYVTKPVDMEVLRRAVEGTP